MEISDSFSSPTSKSFPNPPGLTDDRHGVIKYCDEFPGFTRFKFHQPYGATSSKSISVPRSHAKHPTDTYPDASETSIRKAISTFLPRFMDREIFNKTMCWCTDTADASLLICEHPKWKNFILATGDSGYVPLQNQTE
jgi:sarcosine oxidase/L-pipecolate oxidase